MGLVSRDSEKNVSLQNVESYCLLIKVGKHTLNHPITPHCID